MALCACAHHEKQPAPAATPAPVAEKVAEPPAPMAAQATLKAAKKQKVKGMIHFTEAGGKVKVEAMLEGLKPGPHGIHIHEIGDCSSADFKSAGGHLNPDHKEHGSPTAQPHHEGDLGNIVADKKGKATLTLEDADLSFTGEHSIIGKAVVVHAGADDLKTSPAGNSGDRIACGVIEAKGM